MKRLIDLEPTWIERAGRAVGIRFVCPRDDGPGPHVEGHQVAVLFENPLDGGPAHPDDPSCVGNNRGRRWRRGGDTFETMSLSPSVDCTTAEGCPKEDHRQCSHTHCWHGHVTSGTATP